MEFGLWELLILYSELFEDFEPKLDIYEILTFGLTFVNIWGLDTLIGILRVLWTRRDDFRPRCGDDWICRGTELDLSFLGIMFISCDFHEFWVNGTSDSYFYGFDRS